MEPTTILVATRETVRAAFRGLRIRMTRSSGSNAWWIAASILLCLAGAFILADIIYNAEAPTGMTTTAIVFQEVANIGTFLAAMAAWFAATAARRKSSRADQEKVSHENPNAQGMSDNDYQFMRQYMSNVMDGGLTQEQANRIESMVKALKAAGKPMELPELSNKNGDSRASVGEVTLRNLPSEASEASDEGRIEVILAQMRAGQAEGPQRLSRVEDWARILHELSPPAYEFVRLLLANGHITADVCKELRSNDTTMAQVLSELRGEGMLVPLVGTPIAGDEELVYWFPPDESENIRIALELESRPDSRERGRLVTALQAAGYFGPEESANGAT